MSIPPSKWTTYFIESSQSGSLDPLDVPRLPPRSLHLAVLAGEDLAGQIVTTPDPELRPILIFVDIYIYISVYIPACV